MYVPFVLQDFPNPLHSAELILQLIRKVSSVHAGGSDREEPHNSVMSGDDNESLANIDCSEASYHVTDKNRSLLETVYEDVQQWALQHAYSSTWIKHFQCHAFV